MKKTKEQERMVAAMKLAGVLADEPAVLLCVQRMLETPWFAPLPRGARKKAKTAVDRLLRLLEVPTSKGVRPDTSGALFDMRTPARVRTPKITTPPVSGSGGTGDPVLDRAPVPEDVPLTEAVTGL